jgi:hypothetical protein
MFYRTGDRLHFAAAATAGDRNCCQGQQSKEDTLDHECGWWRKRQVY